MIRKTVALAVLMAMSFAFSQIAWGAQAGVTDTVFNKRFVRKIKPMMTYGQIVKMTGVQGVRIADAKGVSSKVIRCQWNGAKGSVLRAGFDSGRLVDATILAPNEHTYAIRKNGEVVDLGE